MRVLRVTLAPGHRDEPGPQPDAQPCLDRPDPNAAELRGLSVFHLLKEHASAYRPGTKRDVISLTKVSLRMLARHAIALEEEITEIDAILKPLVKESAPELVATLGIGTDAASALLVRGRR